MRQEIRSGTDNFSEVVSVIPPIADYRDATANDSDKSFTVPNNEMWKLCNAHVLLVSTATVGNRQITMQIKDEDGNVIMDVTSGAVQAASLTRHYAFLQGIYRETSFTNGELQIPIPMDMYLSPGYSIRFFDEAAIDAAADDMTVNFQVMAYKV